jgi:hypothetical protein
MPGRERAKLGRQDAERSPLALGENGDEASPERATALVPPITAFTRCVSPKADSTNKTSLSDLRGAQQRKPNNQEPADRATDQMQDQQDRDGEA